MTHPDLPLIVHLVATVAMTGVIWYVQLAHYPLFALVGTESFARFEAAHVRRTTWVVAPLMLTEAGTLVLLLAPRPGNGVLWTSAALLAVIWLSTGLLQVPLHRRLESGWSTDAGRRLVTTNWIRTIAWTGRAGLVLWLVGGGPGGLAGG